MKRYTRLLGGNIRDNETMATFPALDEKSPGMTGAQREYARWLAEGNSPDMDHVDLAAKRRHLEFEVLQARIAWKAAVDEGLSIQNELLISLEQKRQELAGAK